ncbi:[protein-PII] uridylyltransferase [Aeromicrobium sp. 179-A 4D2 NHS]|uniref:[protein-PII] uridylyltransferase n=1 Tax=Aeromicrobium sp. 179-A 4D2 NHS TaxID=3142375 RepID=UPI0039A323FE
MDLARERAARAGSTDVVLREAFERVAGAYATGVALVAIGGYGRGELSPHSDVDVVLVHADHLDPREMDGVASMLWTALWDAKVPIDQSVRSVEEMTGLAGEDFRVALGAIDARLVAGDGGVVVALRSTILATWRREARAQLPAVRADRDARLERSGQLAYEAVPDLKNAGGGLRDLVLLRAIAATWLVDVPSAEVAELGDELLAVRDALHDVAGKRTDKLVPDLVPDVAERLGESRVDLDLRVRDLGRRIDHLVARAWRRIDVIERDPHRRLGSRGPVIERVVPGVGVLDGEVVLTADADTGELELLFRVATTAARRALPVNEASLARLARETPALDGPLPLPAHRWLVELLSTGRRLVPVWLQLDFAGLVDRFVAEWSGIRLRGSSSPIHRFTVDRHSIEACVNADELNRDVTRPDLLAAAALLHDIGKGRPGDHSDVGAPMAREIALRWGFEDGDADTIARLVKWHLLLPTVATRRDIEDPVTAANIAEIVGTEPFLDLLAALTACDAAATSPTAWSGWRRGLIEGLVAKTRQHLRGEAPEDPDEYVGWPAHLPLPDPAELGQRDFVLESQPHHDGSLLRFVGRDRQGLLADLAGALTVAGLNVRSCRTVTIGTTAGSLWEVTRHGIDPVALAERIRPALDGRLDLAARLAYSLAPDELEPRITVLDAMEQTATLLEVRSLDRRGLVWTVCQTIAGLGHHIRSAHLSTYGDEARDVFYVTDEHDRALADGTAEVLRRAVRDALA